MIKRTTEVHLISGCIDPNDIQNGTDTLNDRVNDFLSELALGDDNCIIKDVRFSSHFDKNEIGNREEGFEDDLSLWQYYFIIYEYDKNLRNLKE